MILKSIRLALILIMIAGTVLPLASCRKGDGDPLLSMRSRKARVAGDWAVEGYKSTTVTHYINPGTGYDDKTTVILVNDGAKTAETTEQTGSQAENREWEESISYSFDKNGSWTSTRKIVRVIKDEISLPPFNNVYSRNSETRTTIESSGTWDFLNGIGNEFKNKERIMLKVVEAVTTDIVHEVYTPVDANDPAIPEVNVTYASTETYADMEEVWSISTLKDKVMEASASRHSSSQVTNNGSPVGSNTTEDVEFTITLSNNSK